MKKIVIWCFICILCFITVSPQQTSAKTFTYTIKKTDINAMKKGKFAYISGSIGMKNEVLRKKKNMKKASGSFNYREKIKKKYEISYYSPTENKKGKTTVIMWHYQGAIDPTLLYRTFPRDYKSDVYIMDYLTIPVFKVGKKRLGVYLEGNSVSLYLAENKKAWDYFVDRTSS